MVARRPLRRGICAVVSCEHGGNVIPPAYRKLFVGQARVLDSHRGHDPGAMQLARDLARACEAPVVGATITRLLIELNRSPHNPRLYSEFTPRLPRQARKKGG